MARQSIDDQIQAHIETFVEQLTTLVRKAAVESVEDALGTGAPKKSAKRATGTRRGAATKRGAARRAKSKAGGKRIKRTSEQLEKLATRVYTHVKSNPGVRLEQISASLNMDSKDLKKPVADLLAAKSLRTTGQRRGTKYFTKAAPKKKA